MMIVSDKLSRAGGVRDVVKITAFRHSSVRRIDKGVNLYLRIHSRCQGKPRSFPNTPNCESRGV